MPRPPSTRSVPVCLRCGFRDIRPQTIRDGLWPGGGEGMAWACDRCGFVGQPLLVDPTEPAGDDAVLEQDARSLDAELRAAPARRPSRSAEVAFGILLVVAGFVFFLPAFAMLYMTVPTGDAWRILSSLGAGGVLTLVGYLLVVLGVRKISPRPAEA